MWLVVGLGNPGKKYEGHRHNIGFMLIDAIADDYSISPFASKFQSSYASGIVAGQKVHLLKPQTFMNESGRAVGEAARFFQILPENILVLHDELDLPCGKVRIKQGGGHGGHNGLRDIDNHIGKQYWRLRFGIDHPGHKDRVTGYVLSDFSKQEQPVVRDQCVAIASHLPLMLEGKHGLMMTKLA